MTTIQQAAKIILEAIEDPEYATHMVPGYKDVNWQNVWTAMKEDHYESLSIGGGEDWPCTLRAALIEIEESDNEKD